MNGTTFREKYVKNSLSSFFLAGQGIPDFYQVESKICFPVGLHTENGDYSFDKERLNKFKLNLFIYRFC